VADFVGVPTSGDAPLEVAFTDQSTNSPTSWDWTFGDGGTSGAQNPSHSYSQGTYTVSLTAANAYGQDSETKADYISASGGGGGDYFPISYTIEEGSHVSGGVSDLGASDDSYLVTGTTKVSGKQNSEVSYTFDTDLSSLSSLTIYVEAHPSLATQRERLKMWDYNANQWVGSWQGDYWRTTTSDETSVTVISSPANYIDPATGEVKLYVRTGDQTNQSWTLHTDMVKITAAP
jgi:PKD repeat protein